MIWKLILGLPIILIGLTIARSGHFHDWGIDTDYTPHHVLIGTIMVCFGVFVSIFSLKEKKPNEKGKNEESNDQN